MKILLSLAAALCLAVAFIFLESEQPARVASATISRGEARSVLSTNGRVMAGRDIELFAETTGRAVRLGAAEGDTVEAGAILAEIDDGAARADLAQARARLEVAQAELAAIQRGLAPAERARIENELAEAKRRRSAAESDLASLQRLAGQNAVARAEVDAAAQRLESAAGAVGFHQRRLQLGSSREESEAAEARAREAKSAVEASERRLGASTVRAPFRGVVYSLPVRVGSYVRPGELVARVGSTESARARIWVDEPELGRLKLHDLVAITADAYPGHGWSCSLDRLPSAVIELGSRRVGEAGCSIEQPDEQLLPNLTVNVEILVDRAEDALLAPREAIWRDGAEELAWTLDEQGRAKRVAVTVGVRGASKLQIVSGLEAGATVLLPGAEPLKEGDRVEIVSR